MENVHNNKFLCLNNEEELKSKKEVIRQTLISGIDVLTFFDTETTGLNIYPDFKTNTLRDRVLEVGFAMYYMDKDENIKPLMYKGKPITFQEYINPFKETPRQLEMSESVNYTNPEALAIHKITNDFLNGKESFNGIKLHKPAPTFAEMKPFMEDILCLDELASLQGTMHFIAHNGKKFDAPMLTEETFLVEKFDPNIEVKRSFESLVKSLPDTYIISQDLFDKQDLRDKLKVSPTDLKPNYSLSYIAHMLDVKEEGREDFHGALLDSTILKNVFQELIKTPQWKKSKNKIEFKTENYKEQVSEIKSIPNLFNEIEQKSEKAEVLTVVKTDASFSEGTGTVKEYVSAAKDAGLKSLVMADVVSVARFVEFYEQCKKAEIKPIVGATFKVESSNDLYNYISKNKESGVSGSIFGVISTILKEDFNMSFDSIEDIINHYDVNLESYLSISNAIIELNKKSYSGRESSNDSLIKLSEKIVKEVFTMTGEKYKKSDIKTDLKKLYKNILENELLIKNKEFSQITDHSDLLLIANDNEGYENIKKLISRAYEFGQHFVKKDKGLDRGENPLITMDMLKEFKESITAVIGHKNDILGKAVKALDVKRSQLIVKELKDIYGENLKAQIATEEQTLNSEEENKFIGNIVKVCQKQNVDVVALHHASFAKRNDFKTHLNKYAILLEKSIADVTLDTGKTKENHIQSNETLFKKYENNFKALNNSGNLINKNTLNPKLNVPSLPKFKTSGGRTQEEELKETAYAGLNSKILKSYNRFLEKSGVEDTTFEFENFQKKYKERLDYELGIINDMDFPGYFLIKKQMIDFCKQEGIPVGAGRGSAAGSLTVYSLGITDVDPIEHGLIFERFLNPERKEMPDIDTDIDGEHREKVLKFLCEAYKDEGKGFSGAAYIMTKGTFSAKNTLKALAKAEGLNLKWADELSKIISTEPGVTLESELENNETLILRYNTEVKTKDIIDQAMKLEGNGGRQISTGKHAGGVVVGNLISQAPITYVKGIPVVQADKHDIESLGAVKFDLLGLNTLSKLDLALKFIENNRGMEALNKIGIVKEGSLYNFDDFSYKDKETFEMLQKANSTNVFQIESPLFKELLKKMKPDSLEEITALVSIGRPGPMQSGMDQLFIENKFNPSKRELYHPLIDNLLDETHGTIIYQEQVMAIAQKLANFTMGGADKLRKAMGKKNVEEMAKQKSLFIEGAKENNVPEELSSKIYDTIEKFAGYGFNKSHALAYSLLTYKTAYLRRHFPNETMAAILSLDSEGNDSHKNTLPRDIGSTKEVNLRLYTPNINKSDLNFISGQTNGILYGLSAIKGASFNKAIEEREKNGSFTNIENYMIRCGSSKSVELLIDSGAMDLLPLISSLEKEDVDYIKSLEKPEAKVLKRILLKKEYNSLEKVLSSAAKIKSYKGDFDKEYLTNTYSETIKLFDKFKPKLMLESLTKEEELLGGFITAHPLDIGDNRLKIEARRDKDKFFEYQTIKLSDSQLSEEESLNKSFNVSGCVKSFVAGQTSKAGNRYSKIEINDETGSETFFLTEDTFSKFNDELKALKGKGLNIGKIVSLNISFYKNNSDQTRISIDEIYFPEDDLAVSLKKQPSNSPKNSM